MEDAIGWFEAVGENIATNPGNVIGGIVAAGILVVLVYFYWSIPRSWGMGAGEWIALTALSARLPLVGLPLLAWRWWRHYQNSRR